MYTEIILSLDVLSIIIPRCVIKHHTIPRKHRQLPGRQAGRQFEMALARYDMKVVGSVCFSKGVIPLVSGLRMVHSKQVACCGSFLHAQLYGRVV